METIKENARTFIDKQLNYLTTLNTALFNSSLILPTFRPPATAYDDRCRKSVSIFVSIPPLLGLEFL